MWRVVVFSCLLAFISGQTTDVSQCTANEGELPIHIYVEGCETQPCVLHQLEDAVINIVFRAPRTMRVLRTLATAYMTIGFITVPIPYDLGDDAITCNFLTNTYCPVLENEVVQYVLRMYIEPIFPVGTSVNLEFRVVDETTGTQVPVFCIRTAVRIAEPRAGLLTATNPKSAAAH